VALFFGVANPSLTVGICPAYGRPHPCPPAAVWLPRIPHSPSGFGFASLATSLPACGGLCKSHQKTAFKQA